LTFHLSAYSLGKVLFGPFAGPFRPLPQRVKPRRCIQTIRLLITRRPGSPPGRRSCLWICLCLFQTVSLSFNPNPYSMARWR